LGNLKEMDRRRYEDNIKMDIKGKGLDGVHWFYVAQETAQ
jgi:hypothetical protein